MTVPRADVPVPHFAPSLRPYPTKVEDISAPWLTSVLQSAGTDVVVSGFTSHQIGEGAGMMSRLERIELEYARGSGPESLIAKLPTTSEANLAVSVAFNLYRREVGFYKDVAPRMPVPMPKVYFADLEGDADYVILMEDLRGYVTGDQIVGCTLEQAQLCIKALPKIHAPFWNAVDVPMLDFLPYHYPSYHSDSLIGAAPAAYDVMLELGGDALPEELKAIRERYIAAIPAMQEWITAPPRTIVQGDFRMDNMFFGTKPDQLLFALVDWQGSLRGKGAHDIAYFLSQSTPSDLRREHERELVALWRSGLAELGVRDYGPEQAWEDYRRAVLYLWTYVIVIAGALDPGNERGVGWFREMIRRSATAIQDLDLLELLPEFE
jgi:Ecdysteroid kinase-like family